MEELTQKVTQGDSADQAGTKGNIEVHRRVSIQDGIIPEENIQSASQAVKEVLEEHCVEEEVVSTVKETQLTEGKDDEVMQRGKELNEGHWTPVQTRRKVQKWCRRWPEAYTKFLNKGISDHSPMVIKWSNTVITGRHSFKFMNHLTLDCDFLNTVTQIWAQEEEGCAMFRLMRNLNRIRPRLIELNRRKYGGLDAREMQARDKLDNIQEMLQGDPMNIHLQKLEKEAREDHFEAYKVAVVFLRQKSKEDWLCDGDLNTKT
ncbi:hypothetical protein RIF29_38494 [Crotalaria pallida]|uniref:Uncharacterized protein n=1 Tax=Crotalaria pallida TaxID=3830 RepID=A0AAN9DZV2_CROPI